MMQWQRVVQHILDIAFRWCRVFLPGFLFSILDYTTLQLVDVVRLFCGAVCARGIDQCKRPAKPLELYEFEGCPFCRRVRETLSQLAIDHIVYPCPRETLASYGVCLNSRYRAKVRQMGGAAMFPFLVDPNSNTKMYESEDIVQYLWKTYGDKATPTWNYRVAQHPLFLFFSLKIVPMLRPCTSMGILRAPSRNPAKPLVLWGHESSPFVRRVKETLSTLELPYEFKVMPMGAKQKRLEFRSDHVKELSGVRKRLGLCKIPYLEDPNTKERLFESAAIVEYLKERYQTASVPDERWYKWP